MTSRVQVIPWAAVAAGVVGMVAVVLCGPAAADQSEVRFNRDIRPIMSDTCFHCHGPSKQKNGFRLDQADSPLKPAKSGAIPIVPGKPDESEIIKRVFSADADELMPPPDSHKVLKAEQKETLRRWVAQGARFEKHWSFQTPISPKVPQVQGAIVRNPIDAFIAQRLASEGLTMSPEADKPTLIRRAAFSLTGLPPTPAEVDQFLADASPLAYEQMVDRYLASKRFGEEMARHWLDVARYGDTHGMHLDNERSMWPYRDWVIAAFNDNKPFDQFTIEQLAGDLLPDASPQQVVATGFNRCNVTSGEGGSIDEEYLFRYAVDRASTTAEAWMGLTAGCAVCHDHKFDPISAKEFYSLYAFFYSAADPAMDGNALLTAPTIQVSSPEQKKKLAELATIIAAKQKTLKDAASKLAYSDPADAKPRPTTQPIEVVWLEDDFPAGAKPGGTPTWVTADQAAPVLSGRRSLKLTAAGIGQNYFDNAPAGLEVPAQGKFFANVWIDPKNKPRSVMLQFNDGTWEHRAVWGDAKAIEWGGENSPARFSAGPLPETGKWVRLEIDAAKVGLHPGDKLKGLAYTQFDGTVYWDKAGVTGNSDPASDSRRSLQAWRKQFAGKDAPGAPAEINQLLKRPATPPLNAADEKKLRDYYLRSVCIDTKPALEAPARELDVAKQKRDEYDKAIPSSFVFKDMPQPRESFVMLRGQYDKRGEKVEPNTLAALPPLTKADPKARATRLDLARWLVSPQHPLTARVTVNRFWQQFFGIGLVKTSFDFGSQGDPPTHPELLDWLAVHFREEAWDVKKLARLMVTSSTFRQSSRIEPALLARDPENRLYARGPRFRLDAEQIRDNVLFVSGLINLEMGGKAARIYQPPNIWEPVGFAGSNTRFYKQDTGNALYRRSIYCFLKRTAPPPFMSNFDGPNREQFCTRRDRSDTPLQALQLMNDVQHFEAARALAQRMITEGGATADDRIRFAYRIILARSPQDDELAIVKDELAKHEERFKADPESAKQAITFGESKPKPDLPPGEFAAYTLTANMLLNLDETITRN